MKNISLTEVKSGMIGLSGGNAWIQRQIMFFTQSNYSHSFVIFKGLSGVDVLETTETIVCVSPLERKIRESNEVEIWEPKASEQEKEAALRMVYEKYAAKWYGYLSYIWFIYRWAMRKIGKEPTIMWKWCTDGVTCTELTVAYLCCLNDEYVQIFKERDINSQSPEELKKIMVSHPKLFDYIGNLKIK